VPLIVLLDTAHITKESGEKVDIPADTLRGKYILMRLEAGLSEITEPIYV
jgi:hypothetical protein